MRAFGAIIPATFVTVTIGDELVISDFFGGTSVEDTYFMSLSVEQLSRTVIKYTVNFQYNPKTFNKGSGAGASGLEQRIKSCYDTPEKRKITIQFGYKSGSPYTGGEDKSPIYAGTIIDMKTNLQLNCINYTIIAYGEFSTLTTIKIPDGVQIDLTDKSTGVVDAMAKLVDKCKENDKIYDKVSFEAKENTDLPSLWNMIIVDSNQMQSASIEAGKDKTKTMNDILLDYVKNSLRLNKTENSDKSLVNPSDFDLITYLDELTKKINIYCKNVYFKSRNPLYYGNTFALAIDHTVKSTGNSESTVNIKFINVTEVENKKSVINRYEFYYGTIRGGDSLSTFKVINWDCTYNDTYAIYSGKYDYEKVATLVQSLSADGENSSVLGQNTNEDAKTSTTSSNLNLVTKTCTENNSNGLEAFEYPYEASLTVLGNPEPINICSQIIHVIPTINGETHHTAGYYLVTGATHQIDASMGFTTSYKLIKVASENSTAEDASNTVVSNGGYEVYQNDLKTIKNANSNLASGKT